MSSTKPPPLRIANDIIYQQMYLNMLYALFFFATIFFFHSFFSLFVLRPPHPCLVESMLMSSSSSMPPFLLSFDRISFDFLSIFSHFLYATGFTDQLLSLWFVCLAIFFLFSRFAVSVFFFSINFWMRTNTFRSHTFRCRCNTLLSSLYVFIERVFIMHTLSSTIFDICQSHGALSSQWKTSMQLNDSEQKSSSWMMFWHKLQKKENRKKNEIESQWMLWHTLVQTIQKRLSTKIKDIRSRNRERERGIGDEEVRS